MSGVRLVESRGLPQRPVQAHVRAQVLADGLGEDARWDSTGEDQGAPRPGVRRPHGTATGVGVCERDDALDGDNGFDDDDDCDDLDDDHFDDDDDDNDDDYNDGDGDDALDDDGGDDDDNDGGDDTLDDD